MKRQVLSRGLAAWLALLAATFCAGAAGGTELRAGVFKPARPAPEVSLRGTDGTDLKLTRYSGKVVALGFGYTSCPDVCPTTLANLAQAREKIGAAARDLQVVYITVDPERDSLQRLKAYLAGFDPTFIGASGTPEQLAAARKAYGIEVKRQNVPGSTSEYFVHHSSFIYLIDRAGNVRALLPFGVTVDDIVHDVRALLDG